MGRVKQGLINSKEMEMEERAGDDSHND